MRPTPYGRAVTLEALRAADRDPENLGPLVDFIWSP